MRDSKGFGKEPGGKEMEFKKKKGAFSALFFSHSFALGRCILFARHILD